MRFIVWSLVLVFAFAAPALAQSIPGPLKVTDSGPSGAPGYAIKGITGFQNDTGVFGYGTVASSSINIDGVVGYVQTPQSVGVVGWAQSTGTSAYGLYGYSATGPGVYGFNNDGGAASIYGYNTSANGTAVFGNSPSGTGVLGTSAAAASPGVMGTSSSADGIAGTTSTSSSAGGFAGVLGADTSGVNSDYGVGGTSTNGIGVFGSGPYGVAGSSSGSSGAGVFGLGFQGVSGVSESTDPTSAGVVGMALDGTGVDGYGALYGVFAQSSGGSGAGVYGESTNLTGYGIEGFGATGGVGVFGFGAKAGTGGVFESSTVSGNSGNALVVETPENFAAALLGVGTGEAGVFFGGSGKSAHPAIVAQENTGGTDYFAAVNATGSSAIENFIVQAGSLKFSGATLSSGASDVQMSGDLYVQGRVYQLCSQGSSPAFPVTMPSGNCSYDNDLTAAVRTRNAAPVTTYAAHQSLPTMEDFGEARLVNGQAIVPLERTFASTIDPSRSYLVFITPLGDCHGMYVAERSASGFVVRELMNGRSTVAFQYRIVAHPYGDRSTRLPSATQVQGSSSGVSVASIVERPVMPHAFRRAAMPPMPHLAQRAALIAAHPLRAMKLGVLPARPPLPQVKVILNR